VLLGAAGITFDAAVLLLSGHAWANCKTPLLIITNALANTTTAVVKSTLFIEIIIDVTIYKRFDIIQDRIHALEFSSFSVKSVNCNSFPSYL
jgi:hypothetical protein